MLVFGVGLVFVVVGDGFCGCVGLLGLVFWFVGSGV